MRSGYVGNIEFQKLINRPNTPLRPIVEALRVVASDKKDTPEDWEGLDDLTDLTVLDSGGVTLTSTPAVLFDVNLSNGFNVTDLDTTSPHFMAQIEWGDPDIDLTEIVSLRAWLIGQVDDQQAKTVHTWRAQLFSVIAKYSERGETKYEIRPISDIVDVSASASTTTPSEVEFIFQGVNGEDLPILPEFEGIETPDARMMTLVHIKALQVDGSAADNVGWSGTNAINSVVSSGNRITGLYLEYFEDAFEIQTAGGTFRLLDDTVGVPRFSLRGASYSGAVTATFTTNPLDLGAAASERVRVMVQGEQPAGTSLTFEISDGTQWWIVKDGEYLGEDNTQVGGSDLSNFLLAGDGVYEARVILTPNASLTASPIARIIGLEDVEVIDLDGVAKVSDPRWRVDPVTLVGEVAECTISIVKDGVVDYRDSGTRLAAEVFPNTFFFRIYVGADILPRPNWLYIDDFYIDDFDPAAGAAVEYTCVSVLSKLVAPIPQFDTALGERKPYSYLNQSFGQVWEDILTNQAGNRILPRHIGTGPRSATTVTKRKIEDSTVKDELEVISYLAGGGVISSQGRITFKDLFSRRRPAYLFDKREIQVISLLPGLQYRVPEFFVPWSWRDDRFTQEVRSFHTPSLEKIGTVNLEEPPVLRDEIARAIDTQELAQTIASRVPVSIGAGLMLFKIRTITSHPQLEVGDSVVVNVDEFASRDPNTDTAIQGNIWALGTIVAADSIMGTDFTVWIRHFEDILTTEEDVSRLEFAEPEVINLSATFDDEGRVTVAVQCREAESVRIAINVPGTNVFPTRGDTQVGTLGVLDAEGYVEYTFVSENFRDGDYCYISCLAYESADGSATESERLYTLRARRILSAQPQVTLELNSDQSITMRVDARSERMVSYRVQWSDHSTSVVPPAFQGPAGKLYSLDQYGLDEISDLTAETDARFNRVYDHSFEEGKANSVFWLTFPDAVVAVTDSGVPSGLTDGYCGQMSIQTTDNVAIAVGPPSILDYDSAGRFAVSPGQSFDLSIRVAAGATASPSTTPVRLILQLWDATGGYSSNLEVTTTVASIGSWTYVAGTVVVPSAHTGSNTVPTHARVLVQVDGETGPAGNVYFREVVVKDSTNGVGPLRVRATFFPEAGGFGAPNSDAYAAIALSTTISDESTQWIRATLTQLIRAAGFAIQVNYQVGSDVDEIRVTYVDPLEGNLYPVPPGDPDPQSIDLSAGVGAPQEGTFTVKVDSVDSSDVIWLPGNYDVYILLDAYRNNQLVANSVVDLGPPEDVDPTANRILYGTGPSPSLADGQLYLRYDVGAGNEYIIGAGSGPITITGQAATLTFDIRLMAEAGSVVLTGQDAFLDAPGFSIAAEAGSVALTGQAVTFDSNVFTLAIENDTGTTYDVVVQQLHPQAGVTATATIISQDEGDAAIGKVLIAESGSVALTGQNATLVLGGFTLAIENDTGTTYDVVALDTAGRSGLVTNATIISQDEGDADISSTASYNEPAGFTVKYDLDYSDSSRQLAGGVDPFFAYPTTLPSWNDWSRAEIINGQLTLTMVAEQQRTAVGGTLATVTLDPSASAVDDFYNGMTFNATGGTNPGYQKTILDYDGTTKVAVVSGWGSDLDGLNPPIAPDATTQYEILSGGSPVHAGTAQGGQNATIVFPATASAVDDFYTRQVGVVLKAGAGVGQTGRIGDYVGATRTAVLQGWRAYSGSVPVAPDGTTDYIAGFYGGGGPGPKLANVDPAAEHYMGPYSYQRHQLVYSANFQGHASGINKYIYHHEFSGDAGPYITFNWNSGGANEARIELVLQHADGSRHNYASARNLASPTAEQATITGGVLFLLETLYYPGTGSADGEIKVWLNGVLIIHINDISIGTQYLDTSDPQDDERVRGHRIDAVWGGVHDVVEQTQTIKVNYTYVSEGVVV